MSKWIKVILVSRRHYMVEREDRNENAGVEAQDVALDECPLGAAYEVFDYNEVTADKLESELRHADGVCRLDD